MMLKLIGNSVEVVSLHDYTMNLQLFADEGGDNLASFPSISDVSSMLGDSAVQEQDKDIAGKDAQVVTETVDKPLGDQDTKDGKSSEVKEPDLTNQEVKKVPQDHETNEAFKNMRKQIEQYDKWAAEKFKDFGVSNMKDYMAKVEEQKAEAEMQDLVDNQGYDEEKAKEIVDSKREAANLKQENALLKQQLDARTEQEVRTEIESQIDNVMAKVKKDGFDITEEQLLKTASENNLSDLNKAYKLLQPELNEDLKNKIIKEYIDSVKKGKAPIEGSSSVAVMSEKQEEPKTFEDAFKNSKEMLKKIWK